MNKRREYSTDKTFQSIGQADKDNLNQLPKLTPFDCKVLMKPALHENAESNPGLDIASENTDYRMVVSVNNSEHLTQPVRMEESSPDPPFEETYKNLFDGLTGTPQKNFLELSAVEECELPLIDLNQLNLGDSERQACKKQIAEASQEWGFFQVINHGISREVLGKMREEQVKLFKKPFHEKTNHKDLNFSAGSYRWGTPSATCLKQLSWSEAFHVSLSDVLGSGGRNSLRSIMEQFAVVVSELSQKLVDILAEQMDVRNHATHRQRFHHRAAPGPPGLQLVKDGKWFAVKPNQDALIINIGDLFQAWSNNVYKSVEHRVVANPMNERYSAAYFFCPSYDTVIQSGLQPCVYRSFSFGEYRKQVQQDVKIFGHKIGLPRFLLQTH
ncbi:UNVERIFIED_CONTAM: Gibberellin 2-beta-dioxygenase 8 [Sesamum calycinum]|uniref:Gibberellin 2-beta-dioxygenase 8 n=1 Tax=Sesamum calycinum TaxID=2727403 RepID=A0AAW2MCL2_9LAMI